jgi:serine/threonine protein kinase
VADDFPSGLAESPVPGNMGQIASYEMVEELGRGGMAVVYRARDVRLGRWVALKVLGEDLARDEAFRRRFIRESRAAAAVDHPNIIPIFDAGEANGVLFIAMRYVGGQDVHSLLNRTGPLPPARATGIVAQVASALDAAHARGLVHRDVKPANMLLGGLAEDGSEDHVYLSDFGISKTSQATTNLTLTGQVLGTLNYLAPEQIEGRGVDGRADAYSLACAAFEMLAGEPPFRREQSLAVMWAQLSARPSTPRPSICSGAR